MKGLVALGALSVGFASVPVGAADADLNRAWAAGYRAGFTCSSLWNGAGKSSADIERDELTGIYREIEEDVRALKADIEEGAKRVSVRYRDDMPPRIAQWDSREGCVTLPIGWTSGDIAGLGSGARPNLGAQRWSVMPCIAARST